MFENLSDGDKVAVVAVHVGAEDALSQQRLDRFNTRIRQAYPQHDFREAWTSRSLIRQMGSNGVNRILTPDELFSQLKKDGYTHVLVQSSSLINDTEMQYLRHIIDSAKEGFKQIRLGEPLLNAIDDYQQILQAITTTMGQEKAANVLMCEGTTGTENAQYALLDYILHDNGYKDWHVGTEGGYPSLESMMKQLKLQKAKKVHLIPFLFAPSTQTIGDLTKEWTQQLQKAGYKVTAETRCLSDMDAILDLFENHIRHAEKHRKFTPKELKLITR